MSITPYRRGSVNVRIAEAVGAPTPSRAVSASNRTCSLREASAIADLPLEGERFLGAHARPLEISQIYERARDVVEVMSDVAAVADLA